MFFIDYINGKKIVRSDLITEVDNFFTTRDICIQSREFDLSENKRIVEDYLGQKLAVNKPVHGVDITEVVDGKFVFISDLTLKMSLNFPESVSPTNWDSLACSVFGN